MPEVWAAWIFALICGRRAENAVSILALFHWPLVRLISCGRLPFDLQFPFPFQWRFDWPCGIRSVPLEKVWLLSDNYLCGQSVSSPTTSQTFEVATHFKYALCIWPSEVEFFRPRLMSDADLWLALTLIKESQGNRHPLPNDRALKQIDNA